MRTSMDLDKPEIIKTCSNEYYLEGSAYWRLSCFNQDNSNLCEINVEGHKFKFPKESLLLLSPKVFKYFQKNTFPFQIYAYQNDRNLKVEKKSLIQSFREICSLFENKISIEINQDNVDTFLFLSEKLDNFSLLSACNIVKQKKASSRLFPILKSFFSNSSNKSFDPEQFLLLGRK